jgi:fucose permease
MEHELLSLPEAAAAPARRKTIRVRRFPPMHRTSFHETSQSASGGGPVNPPLDFIRITRLKNMLEMSGRESVMPLTVVFFIFLLWGFAYGIITTYYWQFPQVSHHSRVVSFGLHATLFGAYLFGPIIVAWPILQRWGFKATIVTGLSIFWFGMLLFWPATVLISLPALLVASFIAGLGVSVVETAVDLFVTLCGIVGRGEMRLSIARGIQAAGWTTSRLLAEQVLFKSSTSAAALVSVQWVFLVLAIVSLVLAVVYSFVRLPEASDEELDELARRCQQDPRASVCGIRYAWITITLGFLSQFCTIGAQEALQTNFTSFVTFNEPR